jgi:hypothetical protein
MNVDLDKIPSMDLSHLTKHLLNQEYKSYFLSPAGREHYKLLAYFSTIFNNQIILDIGTNRGTSSIAMSYNPTNKVISYDLVNILELKYIPSNIEHRLGDFTQEKYKEEVMSSPLIMLDTDHDGPFEHHVYNFLKEIGWEGYLLLDDIFLNEPMKEFWNSITHTKYDLTSVGHWSGTGLVIFN